MAVYNEFQAQRLEMVKRQIEARGISNKQVLDAMEKVPRHLFVPKDVMECAYEDRPLPIGYGQTISQPFIVAFMTESAMLNNTSKVLEIGTGSGYQAAILGEVCKEVYTIEVVQELSESAKKIIRKLGYKNIHFKVGDGHKGWAEHAPFDTIILTASPKDIPKKLLKQLKINGHMIMPLEDSYGQELVRIVKKGEEELIKEDLMSVRFVPMVGNTKSLSKD